MPRTATVLAVLTLLLCARSAHAEDDSPSHRGVGRLLDRIESAWAERDADALSEQLLPKDALFIAAGKAEKDVRVVDGPGRVREAERAWKDGVLTRTFADRSIGVLADTAVIRCVRTDRHRDGPPTAARRLAVAVYRDGRWRLCFSMPLFARTLVQVGDVMEGSQADKLGVRPGDVVTSYGGEPVTGVADLVRRVRAAARGEAGDKLALTVRRGDRAIDFPVRRGQIGVYLVEHLVPLPGAELVGEGAEHPARAVIDAHLDAVRRRDASRALRHVCPNGFLFVEPGASERPLAEDGPDARPPKEGRILTGSRIGRAYGLLLRGGAGRYDLPATTFPKDRLIVSGDLAICALEARLHPHDDGEEPVIFPVGLQVLVRRDGKWYWLASLPYFVELGMDAPPAAR